MKMPQRRDKSSFINQALATAVCPDIPLQQPPLALKIPNMAKMRPGSQRPAE